MGDRISVKEVHDELKEFKENRADTCPIAKNNKRNFSNIYLLLVLMMDVVTLVLIVGGVI